MKFLFSIVGLVLVISNVTNGQKVCPPSLIKEADLSFAQMVLLGYRGTIWPSNEKELVKMCSPFKGNDKIVRKYARNCLAGLPQQVIGLVLKGAGRIFKTFCAKNVDTSVFQHSPCGNKLLNAHHACMDAYVQNSKNALSLSEDNRMAGSCCSYNKFESCMLDLVKSEPTICTNETLKFFKMIIRSIAGEALDLTCSDYTANPGKCDGINKQMKQTNHPGKSLLLPLVALMRSLA